MDTDKKRAYDSSLPFDDSMPKESEITDGNFFELFEPVFERNSIWSKKKPVPELGDNEMSIKKTKKFYQFWDFLETWRDFSHNDEHKTDEAEDRYEKRWMETKNKAERKKYVKEERKRLNKLSSLAYKFDPRIKAELIRVEVEEARLKQEKYEKKLAERQAKADLIKAKQDAIEKVKQDKLDAELKIKQEKQRILKERKDASQTLQDLSELKMKQSYEQFDKYFFEEFAKKLDIEEILNYNHILETEDAEVAAKKVADLIENRDKVRQEKARKIKEEAEQKAREEAEKNKKVWNEEDLKLLAEALSKVPEATKNRFGKVEDYIGNKFSRKEIIERSNILMTEQALSQNSSNQNSLNIQQTQQSIDAQVKDEFWTEIQRKHLKHALRMHTKTMQPKERWAKIALEVGGKTPKECVARCKYVVGLLKKNNTPK